LTSTGGAANLRAIIPDDGTISLGKETEMQQLRRGETRNYILGKQIQPALKVKLGESFVLETEDAGTGIYRTAQDIPSVERLHPFTQYEPRRANPLAGPVYIEGVEKGDLLVVNIEKIIPAAQGATWITPGSGPLGDSKRWPELGEPAVHIIKHLPGPSGTTRDGTAIFDEQTSWAMKPFIGTIGVAPDVEVETSVTGQGKWGGNWDIRDMKEGTKLYLNSYADGALLFVGDVHGGQGDGEWTGVADETEAEVTLSCEVIKKKSIPYTRLEKADTIISVFAARPMEDAVNTAVINLIDWIVTDYGVKPRDIYFQISTNPDFRINVYQAVKGLRLGYVVGAEYPKKYLPKKAMVSYK
jgi:acetamidase/formamidase